MFIYNEQPETPEIPGENLEDQREETSSAALAASDSLQGASDLLKAGEKEIAGQEIKSPEKAYENLKFALGKVTNCLSNNDKFNIDPNDIYFKQLEGNAVGQSTEEKTLIDPILLLHPATRLAAVIVHELGHQNDQIQNEGLVEAFAESFFQSTGVEHSYNVEVDNLKEFASLFDTNLSEENAIRKIYDLYYEGNYEEIYTTYLKNHINNLDSDQKKDEAFTLFKTVFPELDYGERKIGDFTTLKDFSEVKKNFLSNEDTDEFPETFKKAA